jgi:CBS-domain-containing membrane protein
MFDRMNRLQVRDVMSKRVVEVDRDQSMADAAGLLLAHAISGALVVDAQRRCVGIVSATDFMRLERDRSARQTAQHERPGRRTASSGRAGQTGAEPVGQYMSPAVQTIGPAATLLDAARIMCEQHVHRLPVLDTQGRGLGMVTCLDLVAAMVNVADQAAVS